MIQTYKPQTDLVLADIEALRNGATGISTGTLWEHAEEYPELSNLAKKGIETFRALGYKRWNSTHNKRTTAGCGRNEHTQIHCRNGKHGTYANNQVRAGQGVFDCRKVVYSVDEKICPFMSPDGSKHFTYCQKERCMAWESHHPVDEYDTFEGGICRLIP